MEESRRRRAAVAAVAAIWKRVQAVVSGRVALLEQATAALQVGILEEELRREAEQAAHKLAGCLGIFGLEEGSRLALQAEQALRAGAPLAGHQARRLAELVATLRRELEAAQRDSL